MDKKIIYIFFRIIVFIALALIIVAYVKTEINNVQAQTVNIYKTTIKDLKLRNSTKIDKLKNDVLDRLKSCESGMLKIEDAPIILDTNNRISLGMYMFQRATVIHYYRKLYNKNITKREAVEIALSSKARNLASDIIFNERGGIFNWANCARQKGLVAEVTIIKRIQ